MGLGGGGGRKLSRIGLPCLFWNRLVENINILRSIGIIHLSMSSRRRGGGGIGRDFDIFQQIAVKFPPPGKNVRSNITEIPRLRNDLWSRARTKIQIFLSPGQQHNSNALPPGQSDRSKSRPMPRLPPAGLTLIGA